MSVTFSGSFKNINGIKANHVTEGGPVDPGPGGLPSAGLVFQFSSLAGTSLTGTAVDTWTDSVSSIVLTGAGSKPTFISEDNSIQFDRNHNAAFSSTPAIRTIAAVMKFNDSLTTAGNQLFMFGGGNGGSATTAQRMFQCSSTMLSDNNASGSNVFAPAPVYINGTYINTAMNVSRSLMMDYVAVVVVLTASHSAYLNIGLLASARGFGGNIKELITWNTALDSTEISDASDYLMDKWSL